MMIVRGIGAARTLLLIVCSYLLTAPDAAAFCPSTVAPSIYRYEGNGAIQTTTTTTPLPRSPLHCPIRPSQGQRAKSTHLNMFMGSDGGILGIGAPELVRYSALLV